MQSSPATTSPRRRLGRRGGSIVGEVLLWVLAALGTTCILLVILAFTANVSLIMFRTGSMSPTIPAGSVAVVQRVPAEEVRVGDVVTVDRGDELPVTHRIVDIAAGDTSDSRLLTLRGDANAQDDPAPYDVRDVRIVRFSVPGVATAVAALQTPAALAAMTVTATALVLWAFWPRRSRPRHQRGESGESG